jgi:hypothetical protein
MKTGERELRTPEQTRKGHIVGPGNEDKEPQRVLQLVLVSKVMRQRAIPNTVLSVNFGLQ